MSTNIKTISLLTVLALSAVVLTACNSNTKEPSGFAPKTTQSSKSPSSTSSSAKIPSSSSKATVSEKRTVSSSQEQASTSPSQTTTSSTPQSNQPSVAETSPSSTAPSQETAKAASTTTLREQSDVKPLPPGVAAGTWVGFGTINDDGTMVNSDVIIWRVEPQTQGVIYMGAGTPGNGGFYVHYYPAGVKIPFDNFEDPTDISKDRLIAGDGGYLNISENHINDRLVPNVHYRQ